MTGPGQDGLAADRIRLRVDNAIPAGKRINIYYTDPSTDNDTAAIQDEAGNDAESFYVGAKRSEQSSEGLSIADAQATEGTDASLAFVVTARAGRDRNGDGRLRDRRRDGNGGR